MHSPWQETAERLWPRWRWLLQFQSQAWRQSAVGLDERLKLCLWRWWRPRIWFPLRHRLKCRDSQVTLTVIPRVWSSRLNSMDSSLHRFFHCDDMSIYAPKLLPGRWIERNTEKEKVLGKRKKNLPPKVNIMSMRFGWWGEQININKPDARELWQLQACNVNTEVQNACMVLWVTMTRIGQTVFRGFCGSYKVIGHCVNKQKTKSDSPSGVLSPKWGELLTKCWHSWKENRNQNQCLKCMSESSCTGD